MTADFVKNVSFYSPEQEAIARQRKLAEMLMQQGQTPFGPTENIGGWAVKRSPMEGLGKMAQSLSGAYQQSQADDRAKALAKQMQTDRGEDYGKLMAAQVGQPEIPIPTDEAGGGPGRAAQPATGITPALIAQLRSDEVRQLAGQQMMKQSDPYTLGEGQKRFVGTNQVASGGPRTFAPPTPPRPQPQSNLSRLIAERDSLPPNDPRRAAYENAIRKESETPRQISPTINMPRPPDPVTPVTIQDPDNPNETIIVDGRTGARIGKGPKLTDAGKNQAKITQATAEDRRLAVSALKAAGYDPATGKDKISDLIEQSTSGFAQRMGAEGLAAVNITTSGRRALNQVSAAANTIVLEMMGRKLGSGISNADRDFIMGQLGDVANANKTADERLAAWRFAKSRMIDVGLLPSPSGTQAPPDIGAPPPGAVRPR